MYVIPWWADKYSTTSMDSNNYEMQPILDILWWFTTYHRRWQHYSKDDGSAFQQYSCQVSKFLKLCFTLLPNSDENIDEPSVMVDSEEVKQYQRKLQDQLEAQLKAEKDKTGGSPMICIVITLSHSSRHYI